MSFRKVLSPKVDGTINLDRLTKNYDFRLFILFSSIAAIIPNQGQSDYASANMFLNEFSYYRNNLLLSRKREGITLSINWPLWQEGGMSVTPAESAHLYSIFGMKAIDNALGVQIF